MTREEAVSIIEERIHVTEYVNSSYVDCVDIEALRMAIKALRQPEPCKDTISRQAAIDALMAEPLKCDDSSVWESARCHQWMMDMDVIKALPSAQTERKAGKWIYITDGHYEYFKCDQCEKHSGEPTPFCRYCGADMRGEQG